MLTVEALLFMLVIIACFVLKIVLSLHKAVVEFMNRVTGGIGMQWQMEAKLAQVVHELHQITHADEPPELLEVPQPKPMYR